MLRLWKKDIYRQDSFTIRAVLYIFYCQLVSQKISKTIDDINVKVYEKYVNAHKSSIFDDFEVKARYWM